MTKSQRRIKKRVARLLCDKRWGAKRSRISIYFEPHQSRGQTEYIVTACERGFARHNLRLKAAADRKGEG